MNTRVGSSTSKVPIMRHLLICLLLVSAPAGAARVGVGASVKDGDTSIYVPIDISPRFRIEPYVRHYGIDSSTAPGASLAPVLATESYFGTVSSSSSNSESTYETLSLGSGMFALTRPADNALIYYGARLAYVESESTIRSDLTDAIGLFQPVLIDISSESDGYAITPSAGLEYFPVERFSIAVEIGWEFSRIEGSSSITGSPDSQSELEESRTHASVIVRMFF